MKKLFLIIPFLMVGQTVVMAGELPSKNNPVKQQSSKRKVTPKELQAKIDKFNNYLTNLPIEIQKTIGELNEFKDKGNRAEVMVKTLLVTLDNCAIEELDSMAEEVCESLSSTNVGSLIREKKEEIKNAIAFINEHLKELKKKEGNTQLIQNGIKSLENARDILLGKI